MDDDVNTNNFDKKVIFDSSQLSKLNVGKSPFPRRKFSIPATLHSNLRLSTTKGLEVSSPLARRRFSNVGDVVTRKLSNTIGWRTQTVPTEEVISQGKVLCGQYIRNRLKRSGIFK